MGWFEEDVKVEPNPSEPKVNVTVKDDKGRAMWSIQKERPGSRLEIAGAMAGVLSWEARGDAIAAGAVKRQAAVIW